MIREDQWFTEEAEEIGTAFSLRIHEKLHEEKSEFQTIAVYDTTHYGRLLTIDGYVMLTGRDNFVYHEMMTHPAIFAHGNVREAAIVGGGDCGSLREILKHREVEAVTQIDIDERVTRVAERFFPELCERNDDPRATLAFADGIAWMREREAASLDLIVVDSTDPIGPAEGLFNEAFYRDCRRALRPDGILVQQSESPLAHTQLILAMHAAMKAAGFAQTHVLSFPQPVYPTGWWSATLARAGDTPPGMPEDIGDLDTDYYTAEIHRAAFAQPAFLRRELTEKLPKD